MSCDPNSSQEPSCEKSPGPGLLGWLALFAGGFAYSAIGLIAVVLLVFTLIEWGRGLAQLANGKVELLEGLPGIPNLVKASPDGALWVRTMYRGSISRRSDGHWQVFQGPQWSTRSGYPFCGFALDGTEVWTAVDGKLLHYDGRRWHTVADVPIHEGLAGIAAKEGRVWVLGGQQLAGFDGHQWRQHDLSDQLAELPNRSDPRWQDVSLAATGDGSLWLAVGGLWRLRDGQWSVVSIARRRAVSPRIVGTEGGRLWVVDGRSLVWISPDGQDQGAISYDTIGLSHEEQVDSVVLNNGQWVVSTGARILQRQGDAWIPLYSEAQTDGRFAGFQQLAQASGGFYAVVRKPYALGPLAAIAVISMILAVLMVGGLYLYLPPPNQAQAAMQKAVLWPMALMTVGLIIELLWRPDAPAHHVWFMGLVCFSLMAVFAPAVFIVVRGIPLAFAAVTGRSHDQVERYRFDPVADEDLPYSVAFYFNHQQPQLEAIGFRRIGQYRHKRNSQHFGRHFYHSELGMFAALEYSRFLILPIAGCSFLTLLDDGTYLETGNSILGKNVRTDRFHVRVFRGRGPEGLLKRHLQEVAELQQQHGAAALPLRQESLESLALYGLKLCYERLVEEGVAPSNPYAEIEPMDLIRNIAGSEADDQGEPFEPVGAAR